MDSLTLKTFTTSRSLTYTFHDSGPTPNSATKPALLLLHGFPDGANLWSNLRPHLAPLHHHRIIAPNLFGYGNSSAPTHPALLNSKATATDLAELLTSLNIPTAIAIGHDWGSFLATRLWLWHPSRVAGVAMLNVHYIPPGPFDLDAVNAQFEAATGAPRYAYWDFLANDPDAAALIERNLESFWCLLHGDEEHLMARYWCRRGEMRRFVEADERVPLREYARAGAEGGLKEGWWAFVRERGVGGALCWYKALAHGHHWAVEKELPGERLPITVPSFYLGCTGDDVCLPGLIDGNREAGLVPDLTVKVVESGHWCLYEKPVEVGEGLREWLEAKF